MNARIFNICLLIGWGMAIVGGCLWNLAAGLAGGGLLLLLIVIAVARFAGVYMPKSKGDG